MNRYGSRIVDMIYLYMWHSFKGAPFFGYVYLYVVHEPQFVADDVGRIIVFRVFC